MKSANWISQTGRIGTITAGPSNTIANYTYAFDTVGNLDSRIDATQSLTETFQYDTRNRMTQATIGATTKTTSYNSVGNILGKVRLGAATTNTYTYPLAGQPKPTPLQVRNALVGSATSSVTDARGRIYPMLNVSNY